MWLLRWAVLALLALAARGSDSSETTETTPQSKFQEDPPSNPHNDSHSDSNLHTRVDSHPLVENGTVKTKAKATTPVSPKATKAASVNSSTLVKSSVTRTKSNVALAEANVTLAASNVNLTLAASNATLTASNATLPVSSVSASAADWPCAASEVGLCESLAGNVPQGSALWSQMKARLESDTAVVDLIKTGPRIIWVSTDNGLSNSWQGAVAFFYIAMLTDTLFFMDMGNSSQWEWGYEPHAIDWRVTPTVREALNGIPTTTLLSNYDTHGDELKEHFERGKGGFRSLFKGKRVLHVVGNRVHWQALFKNAHHVAALAAYQVTSVHAFGCAVGFLARVRKDGCGDFERRAVALLRANDTMSVGVQIRLGVWGGRDDKTFADPNATVVTSIDPFAEFFLMALRQCKLHGTKGSQCVIYFISDSMPLRKIAARAFAPGGKGKWAATGATLLTKTEGIELRHIRMGGSAEAFLDTVWESWLFGLCDSIVATASSSFGKVANAWRAAQSWAPKGQRGHPVVTVRLPKGGPK